MSNRFEELIAQGEGISIEVKECKDSLPKSIFETLCSFLNRFGGDIFLGVADDGTIIGIDKEKSKKLVCVSVLLGLSRFNFSGYINYGVHIFINYFSNCAFHLQSSVYRT